MLMMEDSYATANEWASAAAVSLADTQIARMQRVRSDTETRRRRRAELLLDDGVIIVARL
jgi:hypothetical protein